MLYQAASSFSQWIQSIAAGLAALAALSAFLVSKHLSDVEKRKIVTDIYERLFTRDECVRIMKRIELGLEDFWLDSKELKVRQQLIDDKAVLTEFELDEYLGYFELLGGLLKRRAVKFEDIYDAFGLYIENAWRHGGVHRYVQQQRREYNAPDIYEHFEYLSGMVILHKKRQGRPWVTASWLLAAMLASAGAGLGLAFFQGGGWAWSGIAYPVIGALAVCIPTCIMIWCSQRSYAIRRRAAQKAVLQQETADMPVPLHQAPEAGRQDHEAERRQHSQPRVAQDEAGNRKGPGSKQACQGSRIKNQSQGP